MLSRRWNVLTNAYCGGQLCSRVSRHGTTRGGLLIHAFHASQYDCGPTCHGCPHSGFERDTVGRPLWQLTRSVDNAPPERLVVGPPLCHVDVVFCHLHRQRQQHQQQQRQRTITTVCSLPCWHDDLIDPMHPYRTLIRDFPPPHTHNSLCSMLACLDIDHRVRAWSRARTTTTRHQAGIIAGFDRFRPVRHLLLVLDRVGV